MTEYIGLRSKLYNFTNDKVITRGDMKPNKVVCKGVKTFVKNKLTMDDFRHSLQKEVKVDVKLYNFRSINHTMYTQEITKTALSPFDDKRYILSDGITTRALGHYLNEKSLKIEK